MIRYHHMPTRMAEIKRTDNIKCWQGWEATEILTLAGTSVKWFNMQLPYDLPIPLLNKEKWVLCLLKGTYTNVHSSILHNNQKRETPQMPISRQTIQCRLFLQGNTIQPWKATGCWVIQQHGWFSWILDSVKEARLKVVHAIWIHLYEGQVQEKLIHVSKSQNSGYFG